MSDLSAGGLTDLAILLATEQWASAERVLRRASENEAASASIFFNLAKVLQVQGKHGERRDWLLRALARDPNHSKARFELAQLHLEAGDWGAAEAGFLKTVALDPMNLCAWREVARLRQRRGDARGVQEALMHLPKDAETTAMARRAACISLGS